MPAAAIGVLGAVSSAGAAVSAIGAISAAGTAALTVGSVASITTFVGSVTTVVGAVTGDQNLLKVGSVLGAAGAVTGLAANNFKLFGDNQTLGAAVKTGKAAEAAQAASSAGVSLDFSLSGAPAASGSGLNVGSAGMSSGELGGTGLLDTGLKPPSITPPPSAIQQAANQSTAATAAASTTPNVAGLNTSLDTSLLGAGNKAPSFGVDLTKPLSSPMAFTPDATDGFSFNKVIDFFQDEKNARTQDEKNARTLQGIGTAWQAVNIYEQTEQLGKLRKSQGNLLDTQARIMDEQVRNASAAGRLYGGG